MIIMPEPPIPPLFAPVPLTPGEPPAEKPPDELTELLLPLPLPP